MIENGQGKITTIESKVAEIYSLVLKMSEEMGFMSQKTNTADVPTSMNKLDRISDNLSYVQSGLIDICSQLSKL